MRVEASTAMGATSCPKHVVDDASPATEPQAARDHPEQRRLPDQDRQHGITVLTGAPLETLGRGGGARETVDASLALRRAATERLARMMNGAILFRTSCPLLCLVYGAIVGVRVSRLETCESSRITRPS